jgi:hypothetical protein
VTPRFLLLSLTLAGPAAAQEPLVTDRPDFTESASAVERGHAQLEGGATLTDKDGENQVALGEVLVRVGVAPRLELRVAGNSYVASDGEGGFEDAGLGLKLVIVENTALLAGTSVPTGSSGVGSDAWDPEVRLAHQRALGDLAVGANVGWFSSKSEGDRRHGGLASLALGIPLSDRDGVFLEAYGLAAEGTGGEEAYVDGGLTRLLSDDFQLDARVGIGIAGDDAADWYVGVGAARRW